LNQSYLSTSPRKLVKQLLRIESWGFQCYGADRNKEFELKGATKRGYSRVERNGTMTRGKKIFTSLSTLSVSSLVNVNNRWARRTWSSLTKRSFES
jgi:hypothetical protein